MKTFFSFEQINTSSQKQHLKTTTQKQNEHMTNDIFGPLQEPFNIACNMCDKME